MRIGFVSTQDASDATSWSGIPFQILKQLRAQGAEVEVLSPLTTSAKYLLAPAKLIAKARGKSLSLDHFNLVLGSYARQIESFLNASSVDVVFSTSTIPITLLKCRQPIVTSALHRCTIAAYSSTWAMEAAKRITDASKLRLLPFGSSIPVRHTVEDIVALARQKRANRKAVCELLFVGVNWERKGGEIAVETAQILNEAGIKTTLRVVGTQPQRSFPSYVEPIGFINKNSDQGLRRLVDLYYSADFFILPTKAEAAGIVFSEASSFGLPSLAYATGGVPDYVRDGVNGVCLTPGAPAAEFADNIRKMLSNPAEYEALSVRAFLEYKARLNWEMSVQKLVQICRECVEA